MCELKKCVLELVSILQRCSELEQWGMVLEASEELVKASHKLEQLSAPESGVFSHKEKLLLQRIAASLQQREKSLQDLSSVQDSSVSTSTCINRIITALEGLGESSVSVSEMEADLSDIIPPAEGGVASKGEGSLVLAEGPLALSKSGSLITSREMLPGLNYLTISINKFGIKDPQNHLEPYISVSIKNFHGDDIEAPQDTPLANQREASHIQFSVSVLVSTPLEELPEGAAIFFEFKHYKTSKKRVSTKCFSFMEMDEIKPGKAALEIYKKPTDFHRKKLSLLSAKPLYLELTLNIHKS